MSQTDPEILLAVAQEFGAVTADFVVLAARRSEHPWHHLIDWDDEVAGPKHRLQQARQLIRSVRYERHTETKVLRSVAYVRDPDADAGTQRYVSVASLRSDEDRARGVLIAEFSRVVSALKRARELAEVLALGGMITDLLENAESVEAMLLRPAAEMAEAPSSH